MGKAFSLIEMIFVITIIAILSLFAIKKIFFNIKDVNILKLKNDVLLIKDGIKTKRNRDILLSNDINNLDVLDNARIDTAGEKLFINVLDTPIISVSSTNPKARSWSKESSNSYSAWIDKDKRVVFIYENGDFNCDLSQKFCEELLQ